MDDATDVGGTGSDSGTSSDTAAAESTSDAAVDLETVAADFEAEALGELASQRSEDGTDTGKGSSPASPDPLDQFIQQNYGGDKHKFLEAQYAQRIEQKRLADRLEELSSRVTPLAPRDTEAEVQAARARDAEFVAIDQELKFIDTDQQSITAQINRIANRASELDKLISGAEGKLLHADDIEKPQILHDRNLWKHELLTLRTEFSTNERARVSNDNRKRDLNRELGKIDRDIRASMAAEEKNQEDAQKLGTQTWNTFVDSYDKTAKEYGLKPQSAQYNFMRDSVRTQLAAYIEANHNDGIDANGLHEAVGRIMGAAAAAGFFTRKPAANGKLPTTPKPILPPRRVLPASTNPGAPPARSTSPKPKANEDPMDDPDFIRRRAAAVFEAANRNAGKSRGLA